MLDKKHNLVTLWGHLANVTAAITLTRINISYLVSDIVIMGYNIDKNITNQLFVDDNFYWTSHSCNVIKMFIEKPNLNIP